jgi:hypothetical protein
MGFALAFTIDLLKVEDGARAASELGVLEPASDAPDDGIPLVNGKLAERGT